MQGTFFVSGATGNVGKEVIKHLLEKGQKVIAAKRHQDLSSDKENLIFRHFDFLDSKTWDGCLEGVNKVFLMRPPHISKIKRDMYPFMKYMKDKGIQHVVFLSVQGAEKNKLVPHQKIEVFLGELEIPYTFVRPSFFMQNLTTTHLPEIRDDRMIFVPAGKGKTNFIDVRDIGKIITLMFFDSKHINKAYTITGDRSYSYQEVADYLSDGLNRKIEYVSPNPARFVAFHLKRGRKLAMTLVMLALYSLVKSGKADITSTTSKEILGRETISLEEFIRDHKNILLGDI
ncbi:MAG: NAD-dependent epimerase/dehydratase family protein [Spirochaetaceae bacterium]|nr:MAG: NAD-dependent epimerase/dehydratase family protein [Spirochaetaceae bacterium]